MTYAKHIEYRATILGIEIAFSPLKGEREESPCDYYIEVEDVRKNGQEDCHMGGTAEHHTKIGWRWAICLGETAENFTFHEGAKFADAILDHLNQFPHPEMRK